MKQIPNFPNYAITKDGRVWNCKHKRWLKPIKHKTHRTVNQNGESNVQCKLTEKDVINIVHLWNTKLFRQQEIADMYNISRRNVSHIINRETWKYIWSE